MPDVWTYLHYSRDVFLNPLYLDPSSQAGECVTGMLFPPLVQVLRNVTLWTDYFFRWNFSSGNASPFPLPPFADTLHQSGFTLPQQSLQLAGGSPDFYVPAVVTQEGHWESLYKRVLSEKLELQQELSALRGMGVADSNNNKRGDIREGEGDGEAAASAALGAESIEDIEKYLSTIGGTDSDMFSSP